jgi:hypothetical protein
MKTFIRVIEPGEVEAIKAIFSTVAKHMMQLLVDLLFESFTLKAPKNKLGEFVCPLRFVFSSGKVRSGEIVRCEPGGFATQFDCFSFNVLHTLFPFWNENAPDRQGRRVLIAVYSDKLTLFLGRESNV